MDDNQILTLANAERIPMSDKTKMTFEVENLDNASPATVSRCGIIFVSPTDLFWEPLFTAWAGDSGCVAWVAVVEALAAVLGAREDGITLRM